MIKFYKRLQKPQVISFDLDDTLYNNVPVILQAERTLLALVNQQLFTHQPLTLAQWMRLKQEYASKNSTLAHDVSALRRQFLCHLYQKYEVEQADILSQAAYQTFYQSRNAFKVTDEQLGYLKVLKQHYRLIAITNGNAEPDLIGLKGIFEHVVRPENGRLMKPHADIFNHAAQLCQVELHHILHIGDSVTTDVGGAIKSGMQAGWFNPANHKFSGVTLPHFEYQSNADLNKLII
ncbi:HAD-IA family hydrolase [Catenovulum sediminis]|uniref:HAD-IA family hydrolase n=1 Tax=Catenovulum sediminis TaxID=1740262 RepID=A0ABV1RJZ9_9ALTE|nr:HAD-IA family hydrolase [Catenovulum sediminis]